MNISRMDLADIGSPFALVREIYKLCPDFSPPISLEELCEALDIDKIIPLKTEGFEGGLITDASKNKGNILYNEKSSLGRKRFTIAHELGHFLIPSHKPLNGANFMCNSHDMKEFNKRTEDKYKKQEAQANEFASLLLMPPWLLRERLEKRKDPCLQDLVKLAREYQVSKEAMARTYCNYHNENIAIVFTHQNKFIYYLKNQNFPFITLKKGQEIFRQSGLYKKNDINVAGDFLATEPSCWIDTKRGQKDPEMYEQIYLQQDNRAMILLQIENVEEEEE